MRLNEKDTLELRDFLEMKLSRRHHRKISVNAALMHDLGLYGEDIDIDLIWFLEEEYDISREELNEVLDCEIMDYFRPEFYSIKFSVLTIIFPFILLYLRNKYEDKKRLRFTVGMLEDAIDEVLKNRETDQ